MKKISFIDISYSNILFPLKRVISLRTYVSKSPEYTSQFRQEILNFERPYRSNIQSPFSADFDLPSVKKNQQTVRRCITLGGVGLHTADYAFIRIRPARAGEGRYFVIVPKGFISESSISISAMERMEDGEGLKYPSKPEKEWKARNNDQSKEAFLAYENSKSKIFNDSSKSDTIFEEDFFQHEHRDIIHEIKKRMDETAVPEEFEIIPRSPEEINIPAQIEFARGELYYTTLEKDTFSVLSVEHLLAALEACGVDNCRIELEGGREVPIIDGSAHGWTTLIIRVGVVTCQENVKKGVFKIQKPLLVTGENGSFISAIPSETTLITAGWDGLSRGAESIGRSWYTWDIEHDYHFHYSVAPAKTFYHSEFELDALYDSGLVQAGPTLCAIVGLGQTFDKLSEVTFPNDEAARHKVIDFTGDLGLLTSGGQGGIPIGHLVAWNANHALQIKFCIHLWKEIVKSSETFLTFNPPKIKPKAHMTHSIKKPLNNYDEKFSRMIQESEENEEKALQQVHTAIEDKSLSRDFRNVLGGVDERGY